MKEQKYDLIIIGGGPGGYTAALRAAKKGWKVLLCESDKIGGTCLNVGCIPTKFLVDKAAAFEKMRSLAKSGIIKDPGSFSFAKIRKEQSETVAKLVNGLSFLIKKNNIVMEHSRAVISEAGRVTCGDNIYTSKDIILATGSVSANIPVKGAEFAIDSTRALNLDSVPDRLTIIGGGVIGMEFAGIYASFGSKITVLEAMPELYPSEERFLVNKLVDLLKKRGINIITGATVKEIRKDSTGYTVLYDTGTKGEVKSDLVLTAAGRKTNLNGIEADKLGLKLKKNNAIAVNEYMETNIPHLYAIGDAAGGYQLAHAAFAEAETAIDHIAGGKKKMISDYIPRCIYTIPPFASVGMSSLTAKDKGMNPVCGTFNYSGNGMALVEGAEGCVNVVMDKESRSTLGVTILGECAPELISFAALAVSEKLTLEEWEDMIVAHPSLSEILKEAAEDCFGCSINKPGKVR